MALAPNINIYWTSLIFEELWRLGVRHCVWSPGSRIAPLCIALAENTQLIKTYCHDERSAGFFALGLAKSTGTPVCILSTSGTAVCNFMPAVAEASNDEVPLIFLTADRPPELRQAGANQTIDQIKLFGTHVRFFMDLPCPDAAISPRWLLSAIDDAYAHCNGKRKGPVHINCMFRDPLYAVSTPWDRQLEKDLAEWRASPLPITTHVSLSDILSRCAHAERGLVIVGALSHDNERRAAEKWIRQLGWPALADVSSGLRTMQHCPFVPYYDHMLLSDSIRDSIRPDMVLHIGGRITSKRLQQYLAAQRVKTYLMLPGQDSRIDPDCNVTHRCADDLLSILKQLSELWSSPTQLLELSQHLMKGSSAVQKLIGRAIDSDPHISEPFVAKAVSERLQPGHGLFLANSMPIRDMDMFCTPTNRITSVMVNRGVSGIDGNIGTIAGFARGYLKPVTAVIGDLTFLHDLGGLSLLRFVKEPICLIVINNGGGGIFSFFPVTQTPEVLTPYFDSPQAFELSKLGAGFYIDHVVCETKEMFLEAYQGYLTGGKHRIIEVRSKRDENFALHEQIKLAVINGVPNGAD